MSKKWLAVSGWWLACAVAILPLLAVGRGEPWVPPPPMPPPVETLTNEARYIEWKFRTNVTDRTTGLDASALKRECWKLYWEIGESEPWCVAKARMFAMICDRMAFDVSPLDWYPAFAVWNRYDRPYEPVFRDRANQISQKFHAEASRITAERSLERSPKAEQDKYILRAERIIQ